MSCSIEESNRSEKKDPWAALIASREAQKCTIVDNQSTAGASTTQGNYSKKAGAELICQTGMDGKPVIANNIDTKNQLGQGNQDNNENNKDQAELVNSCSSSIEANSCSFDFKKPIANDVKNFLKTVSTKGIDITPYIIQAAEVIKSEGTLTDATNQWNESSKKTS